MTIVTEQPKKPRKPSRRPYMTVSRLSGEQLLAAICPDCNVIGKRVSGHESGASRVQYRVCPQCGKSLKVSIGQ